jgi:putative modified peptide
MSDAALTNEQAMKLLSELAKNDGFRKRFEEKPAAALVELGIPHETVINLNAACLEPTKLASKAKFESARKRLGEEVAGWCAQMIIPNLRLDSGKAR